MKAAFFALSAASSVAAQAITLQSFPDVVAAIDPDDPQYTACSAAQVLLEDCINAAGGTDAVLTADPTALVQCACCVEETPISPVFSICSTYLTDEAPAYSTQASAYGDLYNICGLNADCAAGGGGGGGGGSTRTVPRTTESLPTETETPTQSTESIDSSSETITSASVEQTYATACVDMIAIFTSCTNKIDDFTDLPNSDRASCYCCQTNFNGQVQWTDELDKYASTCRDWARTGEPDTAYSVAQTFASFCENFTDACDGATATDSGDSTSTNDVNAEGTTGSGSANGGGVTVTVTPTASQTGNAAAGLHIGVAGAVAAVVLAL